MANNFVNSFTTIPTAGENYQSTGSATDNATGPQLVYTANNGSSGVNSILVELDAANTGTASIALTAFIQDTSATLGSITSIVSTSDVATVTTGSAHGLSVGQYVHVTVQQLHTSMDYIKLHLFQVQQHSHMHRTLVQLTELQLVQK